MRAGGAVKVKVKGKSNKDEKQENAVTISLNL
jgi:hypothetical protein